MSVRSFSEEDCRLGVCTHEEYYGQFVTQELKDLVLSEFSIDELRTALKATRFFFDLGDDRWNRLASAHSPDIAKVKVVQRSALGDTVRILKEAARQLVFSAEKNAPLELGFNFRYYSHVKPYQGRGYIVVGLDREAIDEGTMGIASALDRIVKASSGDEWPKTFDPLDRRLENQKLVYKAEYIEIRDLCLSAMNYQAETNPDGNFTNASCWVEFFFESDSED